MRKRLSLNQFVHRRRGAVIVLAALLMVVVLGMVAFTIDIGYITHVKTELQRTADACALAAVAQLPDQEAAVDTAQSVAKENYGTAGPDLELSDIEFGYWDRDTATFTPSTESDVNGVRVTVRRSQANDRPIRLFFAPILGQQEASISASAIAMYDNKFCGPLIGIDWISVPGSPTTDSYRSGDGPYGCIPRFVVQAAVR